MHYDTAINDHGMKFDPFKALVVPRPIGWVSTVGRDGVANLAPYSFFNGVSDRPPMVMFASAGTKDTLANVLDSGEFTCSLSTMELRDQMNLSSAPVARGVSEFDVAGLESAPSRFVKPPRVARSPAAFECKLWKTVELPGDPKRPDFFYTVVFGTVVGIYIDEAFIRDGRVDVGAMKPLSRLGYMDYGVITPETIFELNRPTVAEDGRTATVDAKPWDGVYR